jgi:AraC-like DNA-binding protein
MLLKDFLPDPENRELIRLFRIIHLNLDERAGEQVKAYPPRPEHVLSFFPKSMETANYDGQNKSMLRSVLTGQHGKPFNRTIRNEFLCLQIVFQPCGLFRITGISSHELNNQYLDAELIFGKQMECVNDQLFHAASYHEILLIANAFSKTLKPKKSSTAMDQAGNHLLHHDGNSSLDWLAKESSLSIKQFERNFRQRTGITPKIFSRIARFDKAFRMKNDHPEMDWLSIAVACGYYDYQHLAKDYKDFTSLTPPAFHLIDAKSPERLFGLHEGI